MAIMMTAKPVQSIACIDIVSSPEKTRPGYESPDLYECCSGFARLTLTRFAGAAVGKIKSR
jgi:hypothetical protein